eukprot:1161263-Pelagomonas_calceolata.AAC.8
METNGTHYCSSSHTGSQKTSHCSSGNRTTQKTDVCKRMSREKVVTATVSQREYREERGASVWPSA